jgi:hypothetical protein
MGDALLIGASVAALGALIVLAWLPSRARSSEDRPEDLQPVPMEGS